MKPRLERRELKSEEAGLFNLGTSYLLVRSERSTDDT